MQNQLNLKIQKIESYGKVISYEIKDGRKLIAEIFPSMDFSDRFEVFMDEITTYYNSIEESLEAVRRRVYEFYNGFGGSGAEVKARSKARIKKGFGGNHVEIVLTWG